jgi:penicillin-binding protein 1A
VGRFPWGHLAGVPFGLVLAAGLLLAFPVALVYPTLPSLDALTHYRPRLPLRVYSAQGTLIGEFGEERRDVVKLADVPAQVKAAVLAAEDARFYEHNGVDYLGIVRAAIADIRSHGAREGASTITMQLARNFFLTADKTFIRKLTEVLLAYKIERLLSKDEILGLYINQIYMGQRAYGFVAAARVYFDKSLAELTLAQAALLAGLPKAPSRYNPISNPGLAAARQRYVLSRMLALGSITEAAYDAARAEPLVVARRVASYSVDAAYVAEAVRKMMVREFDQDAYTEGYSVYTTLQDADQKAADDAVRAGILAYDSRHGYRGPESFDPLPREPGRALDGIDRKLAGLSAVDDLQPAVVMRADRTEIVVRSKAGRTVRIRGAGLRLAAPALKGTAAPALAAGAVVRIRMDQQGEWEIAQLPEVQAALVALDPSTGAVLALCGGFDFSRNEFDHALQAFRQPGSSFKPFIYSAALEKGFMPATIVDDSPFVVPPSYPGGKPWAPHNYENDFAGPIPLRRALAQSRNVAAARVIESIGVPYARDYATRFGFRLDQVPPYPTMVLGVGSFTPLQMAAAYAVFANGGFFVKPYLVERVLDRAGKVVFQAAPALPGAGAPQVIDPRNAFIMTTMLQGVVRRGTAARARALGRRDLAGKTGTTDDFVDAWFDGYNPDRVAVAWMGYDQPQSLGRGEVGARAALPIWMDYMRVALKGAPDRPYPVPKGVVSAMAAPSDAPASGANERVFDYFYVEHAPGTRASAGGGTTPSDLAQDQLF